MTGVVKHLQNRPPLCVGNTHLAESEFLTILGVTYDSHLTFEKHLSNVSANAARKLGIVRKASYIYKDEGINATCFRSFVLPLLEYCSPIWMSASARDLSLLDRVARGGRFLFGSSGALVIVGSHELWPQILKVHLSATVLYR